MQADGFGDGIWIEADQKIEYTNMIGFEFYKPVGQEYQKQNIFLALHAVEHFDLQRLLQKFDHTSHLKGIKIGIMGCIVNGPGEMADAIMVMSEQEREKFHCIKGKN